METRKTKSKNSRRRRRPASLLLDISCPAGSRHAAFLRRHLLAAHGLLRPPLRELSLTLVGDRAMADLHRKFLRKSGPTDVLSFEIERDRRGRVASGQVVICVPLAYRQAKRRRGRLKHELLLYALHGMLHLCGFDDRTPSGFAKMHHREDRILCRLGIGPVFEPGTGKIPKRRPAGAKR